MASSPQSSASDDRMNESASTDDEENNVRRESEPVSQDPDRSKLSVEELRKKSRRVYLETRKDKKIDELKAELADEEYLFKDIKLTKREQERIKSKKIALNLAIEHEKAQQMEHIDR